MRRLLLLYSLGVLAGTLLADPLRQWPLAALGVLVLLPGAGACRGPARRGLLAALALLAGLAWHGYWASQRLQARLPAALEGRDFLVSGRVISQPRSSGIATQVLFAVDSGHERLQRRRIRLNDYQALGLRPGQRWQLLVRLRRPHGRLNPGAIDGEALSLQLGIGATGYIRPAADNRLLETNPVHIESLRYRLGQRLRELTGELSQQGVLLALVLGERSGLAAEQWEFFARTGTSHLFVISGLHIGLVAMLGFGLARVVYLLCPTLACRLPRQHLGALLALGAAACYSLLAGFTLPTQRALVMIAVFMAGSLWRRRLSGSLRLSLALAAVLTLNPLAGTTAGFWLSFLAVAGLLLGVSSSSRERGGLAGRACERLLRPQWTVFLALVLPLAWWLQQLSLVAPLVNGIAIPIVGLLVVPLCLTAAGVAFILPGLANALFIAADFLLRQLFASLAFLLVRLEHWATVELPPPGWPALLAALLGAGLLLAPRGLGYRWLALPLLLPLFLPRAMPGPEAGYEVHVLDVGQGLAVLVRTVNHALLYDTGAGLDSGGNSGATVIAPVLRRLGIRRLDMLVISHGDNDHAGGLPGVLAALPVDRLLSGSPAALNSATATPCRAGTAWHWDGVPFAFLHPADSGAAGNNASCVLSIGVERGRVLLPGDIEAAVERRLVLERGAELRARVLLAPHHGSRTSSGYPFIKTVAPDYVVFAAGYRNGFGHPAAAISARYRELGAATLNTSASGMLSFRFDGDGRLLSVQGYRRARPRYWRYPDENSAPGTVL